MHSELPNKRGCTFLKKSTLLSIFHLSDRRKIPPCSFIDNKQDGILSNLLACLLWPARLVESSEQYPVIYINTAFIPLNKKTSLVRGNYSVKVCFSIKLYYQSVISWQHLFLALFCLRSRGTLSRRRWFFDGFLVPR